MSKLTTKRMLKRIEKLPEDATSIILTPEEWAQLRSDMAPQEWARGFEGWTAPRDGFMGTIYGVNVIVQGKDPLVELVKDHYGE